jgi:hypothetical protein
MDPVQITHVLAAQGSGDGIGDLPLRHPQQGGLLPVHPDDQARGREFHAGVHIHDIGGVLKHLANLLGHLDLARVIQAVDLGHQGREHRWAGGDLDDLDVGIETPADLLQGCAHGAGDLVTLAVPDMGIAEVHLDVPHIGPLTQIVLAHQAVEIDGAAVPA